MLEPNTLATTGPKARDRAWTRWVGVVLWAVAVAVMLSAAVYQRSTGPTYPYRGQETLDGQSVDYSLIRSEETTRDARIAIVLPPGVAAEGTLFFRRYPTGDPYTARPLRRAGDTLAAPIPAQPAAGKVEYLLELRADRIVRIPADEDETIIIRFKDPVPAGVLIPHVVLMFLAILVGVRAGLGALVGTARVRRHAWTSLVLITTGGMVLGPVVQKFAFGQYWTGWPLGYDLTDNKTLIMWLAWIVACAMVEAARKARLPHGLGSAVVVAAAVVMLTVYLVPHSLRGSELDYGLVDRGADPAEAIQTGR
jgi:hypothetical protein